METKTREREVLSPEELSAFLGIGRSYCYELLRDEEIPSFKIGRLRKVLRRDAERFLEARAAASR